MTPIRGLLDMCNPLRQIGRKQEVGLDRRPQPGNRPDCEAGGPRDWNRPSTPPLQGGGRETRKPVTREQVLLRTCEGGETRPPASGPVPKHRRTRGVFCSWPHQSQTPGLRHRHGRRAMERLCGSGTRRSSLNIFSESCSPQGPPLVVWTNPREQPGSEPILRFAGWDHPTRGSEPNPGGQSVGPGLDGRMITTDKFTCQRKTIFWGKLITTGTITTRDCIPTEDHREFEQHVNLDLVVPQKRAFPSPNRTVRPEAKGHRKTFSGPQSMGRPAPDGNLGHVAERCCRRN